MSNSWTQFGGPTVSPLFPRRLRVRLCRALGLRSHASRLVCLQHSKQTMPSQQMAQQQQMYQQHGTGQPQMYHTGYAMAGPVQQQPGYMAGYGTAGPVMQQHPGLQQFAPPHGAMPSVPPSRHFLHGPCQHTGSADIARIDQNSRQSALAQAGTWSGQGQSVAPSPTGTGLAPATSAPGPGSHCFRHDASIYITACTIPFRAALASALGGRLHRRVPC